jgi:hypothetical protein
MFVYNVTVSIDESVKEEWLNWMKNVHVPDVMSTGLFTESRILKVLSEEDQGNTFSFQYTFIKMEDYNKYKREFAPKLQKDVADKYAGKFAAFRTLLEVI